MRRVLGILLALVVVAGCGNERSKPADVRTVESPGRFRDARYPKQGVFFRTPVRWRTVHGKAPQISTVTSGSAQIAIWRYPRTEPLPRTREELGIARDELLRAVRSRDPSFDLGSTRIVIKKGLRGVEVVGTGTNQGVRRRVRSLHAYAKGAEVVVDAFAPQADFGRVDRQTFAPVIRSLKLRVPRT